MVASPYTPTATSSARAGAPDGRTDHEHRARRERADLERRAEEPVAARADVQDLGGVDRQQRGGAAEDDGEHVEHHAARAPPAGADEAEALADGAASVAAPRRSRRTAGRTSASSASEPHEQDDVGRRTPRAMPAAATIRPRSAGPVANASAWLVEARVTARGKTSRGTSVGSSAARAGPSKAVAPRDDQDDAVEQRRGSRCRAVVALHSTRARRQRHRLREPHDAPAVVRVGERAGRRGRGRAPAGTARRRSGPRWNGEPVSEKTCQATAARSIVMAVAAQKRLARYATTVRDRRTDGMRAFTPGAASGASGSPRAARRRW